MDKRMPVKSAFTMMESLFCLSILMVMLLLSLPNTHYSSHFINSQQQWTQTIYLTQLKAMTTKSTCLLDNTHLTFNANGNINHAATIILDGHKCIFQLGSGRFYFE